MAFRGLAVVTIAIAVVFDLSTETNCFVPATNFNHHKAQIEYNVASPSSLPALVYGTDGSVVGDDVFENPDDKNKDDNLLDALKTSVADSSVWNIIACAFAPPPHDKLIPELIQDAKPVGLTENSIEIAVAVPASEQGGAAANQLVQILVTVNFPQAWALPKNAFMDAKVSALVNQVRVLEGLAQDRLSEHRSSGGPSRDDPDYYEKMVIEQRWKKRLEEEPAGNSLPEWWSAIEAPFSSLELREEAALLKKLLNEDEFEDDLRALFVDHSKASNSTIVYRASVASVGSSGLFLKARVAKESHDKDNDKDEDDDGEKEIIESASIPFSNPPREVTTSGDLREGVLLLVESVTPMPMPVMPQVKSNSIESEDETITPFNEQVVEMVAEREKEIEKEADDEEPKESDTKQESKEESIETLSRQQPRPPEEEAKLAAKYAAIEDLGERAFTILKDLGMV